MMDVSLYISGGTDKMVRFLVDINGDPAGELHTSRENLTKLADLLFDKSYIIKGEKRPAAPSTAATN